MKSSSIETLSESELKKRSAVAFTAFGFGILIAIGVFCAIYFAEQENGIPWPVRHILNFNAQIGERAVSPERVDRKKFSPVPRGKKARINGDVGLKQPLDLLNWKLRVEREGRARTTIQGAMFSLEDLHRLPKTEVTVQFKCIEGWSEVMSFGGVRFTDFLKANHLGTKSGAPLDWKNHPEDMYKYVGMKTPDGEYYVSLDMKSLLNPNAILAYEQNGEALTDQHGAPLRLYMPNKYGVKSLKRIGTITFTDQRPPDYWEEDGYDWFIGL